MLSDQTIKRDGPYPLPRKILLKMRKIFAPINRRKIDARQHQKLEGSRFTIFSNNCLGGAIYHDAGLQFTSPFINTALDGEDFVKFLERPKYYLSQKFEFFEYPGIPYPLARLDDIEIRFVHYHTNEEAEAAFRKRAERIVWDHIFVIATNHDGLCHPELMERFDKLPYQHKIMYTSNSYPEYPWAVLVPQFKGRFQVRIITAYANFRGQRYYETAFDVVSWISECLKTSETPPCEVTESNVIGKGAATPNGQRVQ